MDSTKTSVQEYFNKPESRIGYQLFLKDSQHFGHYPKNKTDITESQAQMYHHEMIAEALDLKEGMKVLDAGCGRGFVACDLAKRYRASITGVDITPLMIKFAKKRAEKMLVKSLTEFKIMDYTNLEFEDGMFDAVYCVETLCHAPSIPKALSEFFRVLKPGGKLVCMEYYSDSVDQLTVKEKSNFDLIKQYAASPSLEEFQNFKLVEHIKNSGFKNITTTEVNFFPSLKRLYKYARPVYPLIKFFRLKKKFINTTIGVEFYKLAEKGFIKYFRYTSEKPVNK